MLNVPVSRSFGVAPAAIAAPLIIGGGLLWLSTMLDRARRQTEAWATTDRPMDSLNRKVDLRTISDQQLQYAQRQIQAQKSDYIRDPLTGVTVTQSDLNTELLRRSGQGGFLFVPPVVAAPAAAKLGGDLVVAAVVGSGLLMGLFAQIPELLANFWGLVNGPERTGPRPEINNDFPGGLDPSDPFQGTTGWLTPNPGQLLRIFRVISNGPRNSWYQNVTVIRALAIGKVTPTEPNRRFNNYNFTTTSFSSIKCGAGVCAASDFVVGYQVETMDGLPGLEPMPLGVEPLSVEIDVPWLNPYQFPDTGELAKLPPLPAYLPAAPSVAPAINPNSPNPQPQTEPSVVPSEPGPTRPAVPAIAPARPPTIAPFLLPGAIPGAQGTAPDGRVFPRPLPLPSPTPAGNVFPVAGGQPITANGPQATMQAVATEVGRLEQKLDRMLNPGPGGDGTDRLQLITGLLGPIVDALLSVGEGGIYQLAGPCEVDKNGGPKVDIRQVPYLGALTSIGVVSNKIDALAQLLQQHKNLRQPTCRVKPPTGEFVTVNFEQVE